MDGVPADLHGVEKKTPGFAVMVGHRRRAELVGSGTELEDRIEALAELLASHADRLVDLFNQDAMDVQQLSRMHRPESLGTGVEVVGRADRRLRVGGSGGFG